MADTNPTTPILRSSMPPAVPPRARSSTIVVETDATNADHRGASVTKTRMAQWPTP